MHVAMHDAYTSQLEDIGCQLIQARQRAETLAARFASSGSVHMIVALMSPSIPSNVLDEAALSTVYIDLYPFSSTSPRPTIRRSYLCWILCVRDY